MNNDVDEARIKALMHSIGLKYGLQDSVINHIVNSPYKFARETIKNLDFSNIETEEDLDKLNTNFIFKYLFKYYTNFRVYQNKIKQKERLTEYNITSKWKNKEI